MAAKKKQPTTRSLSDLDRELLDLAQKVEAIAHGARRYVLEPEAVARTYGDSVERLKRAQRDALARMHIAWRGLSAEEGAPYHDARMLLTEGIFFYAKCENTAPSANRALSRATALARRIAEFYPKLAKRLREPERIERIRRAIVMQAGRSTKPWKQIAATWDGIEPNPRNPESWRQDWARYETKKRSV